MNNIQRFFSADQFLFNKLVRQTENDKKRDWDKIYAIICNNNNLSKLYDRENYWCLIHYACKYRAPLKVVTKLIKQNPDCVKQKASGLPLHIACEYKQTADVISKLIERYPEAVAVSGRGNSYPIHYMLKNTNTSSVRLHSDIILDMIQKYPDAVKKENNWGWYPLHLACDNLKPINVGNNDNYDDNCNNVVDEIIFALISAYPDACTEADRHVRLYPLHIACRSNQSYNVVKAIYDAYPEAISIYFRDKVGNFPIHYVCENIMQQTTTDVLEFLLQQYPDSKNKRNIKDNKLPIELAEAAAIGCKDDYNNSCLIWLREYCCHQQQEPEQQHHDDSAPPLPNTYWNYQEQGPKQQQHFNSFSSISTTQEPHVDCSTNLPTATVESSMEFEEDRNNLHAVINGTDNKQADLSSEYIKFILMNSSIDAGGSTKLGEGFFGVVYEGRDPLFRTMFAVKTIRSYVIDCGNERQLQNAIETFKKEQEVLSQFQHPNVAQMLGFSFPTDTSFNYYLVYECASKGSLDQFWTSDLGRDRLSSLRQRALIAWNVMAGLRFLHAGNDELSSCFHRDVKSANIVLKDDFTAQLIDCGLAKFVNEDVVKSSGGAKGTPGYLCPEYSSGSLEQYEERCDVYSFGIVLAELWTGKLQNHKTEDSHGFNFGREYVQGRRGKTRNIFRDVDPALGYDRVDLPDHVRLFAQLALDCMEPDYQERPYGLEVMDRLTRIVEGCNKEEGLVSNAISVPSVLNAEYRCVLCRTFDKIPNQITCAFCSNLQGIRNEIKQMMGTFISHVEYAREENADLFQKTFSKIGDCFESISPVLGQLDTRLNNPIPRLFILYPAERKVGWQKFISKVKDKVSEKYCLQFVCAETMVPINPVIQFRVTKNWVKAIAPALAVSMCVINMTCQAAMNINPGMAFKCGFMGKSDIVSMFSELEHVLIEDKNYDLSEKIRSGKLNENEHDIQQLCGSAYNLVIEKATEQMGWRANMEPVTKPPSLSAIWVSKEVARNREYGYKVCVT